jgi:hypothetical protein
MEYPLRHIVIILTLLLTLFATPVSSSVRRLSADPRMGFPPKVVIVTVILDGDERAIRIALVDEEGFVVRNGAVHRMLGHSLWARET